MSALIALQAASFTAAGAGKSGNPCERLMPPLASLRRVISRITDSVNCNALREPVNLDMKTTQAAARRRCAGLAGDCFFFAGVDFFAAGFGATSDTGSPGPAA